VELSKAASGASTTMDLRAEGGSFSVESVRVKAVVQGAREATQELANEGPERRPELKVFRFTDHWAQGAKLSGERVHGQRKPADMSGTTVKEIGASRIVLNSPDAGGGGNFRRDWVLDVSGGRIVVADIRVKGPGSSSFQEVSGSGTITENTISFTYRYRIVGGGKSGVGKGSVSLKKD